MTTGTVSHARRLKGWFVMVKDRKNSHAGIQLSSRSGVNTFGHSP